MLCTLLQMWRHIPGFLWLWAILVELKKEMQFLLDLQDLPNKREWQYNEQVGYMYIKFTRMICCSLMEKKSTWFPNVRMSGRQLKNDIREITSYQMLEWLHLFLNGLGALLWLLNTVNVLPRSLQKFKRTQVPGLTSMSVSKGPGA